MLRGIRLLGLVARVQVALHVVNLQLGPAVRRLVLNVLIADLSVKKRSMWRTLFDNRSLLMIGAT